MINECPMQLLNITFTTTVIVPYNHGHYRVRRTDNVLPLHGTLDVE
jgi:hypothetical protein